MKQEPIPISPSESGRAWDVFHASPMKAVLHNEILKRVATLRDQLESASVEEFIDLQHAIKAHRFLLGLIHRNDPLPTK